MNDSPSNNLLDDEDQWCNLPIVDMLHTNAERAEFVLTFIPDDMTSRNEKEMVAVPQDSLDGRRIAMRLAELGKIVGGAIDRIYHAGGADFGFYLKDATQVEMSDDARTKTFRKSAIPHLHDIAMIGQIAFRERELLKTQSS